MIRSSRSASLAAALCLCGVAFCSPRYSSDPLPAPSDPGARIWTARCVACHDRPHPGRHDFERWQKVLDRMQRRMRDAGQPVLDARELAAVRFYLKRHAR